MPSEHLLLNIHVSCRLVDGQTVRVKQGNLDQFAGGRGSEDCEDGEALILRRGQRPTALSQMLGP
jgi:hypothetical protein